MKQRNVLFITWDGPQVDYVTGLFLPIFTCLAAHGFKFHILQFTWGASDRIAQTRRVCEAAGIPYRAVRVWRGLGGFGQVATALFGARHIRRAATDWGITVLMPRSLMPALSLLALRRKSGFRIIFDADGLVADERVDFEGLAPTSWTYRLLRDIESQMVRIADGVIVRSSSAIDILAARAGAGTKRSKFSVVSNGRKKLANLVPLPIEQRSPSQFRLVYVGSIGKQYCVQEMLSIATALKERIPDLKFDVLTGDKFHFIKELNLAGLADSPWISVDRASPDEATKTLLLCDLGLALRRLEFSTQAVAPVKLGEYALAGLPIVGTLGVGATKSLIEAGVFFAYNGENTAEVVQWVIEEVIPKRVELYHRCREVGEKHFSVERSVDEYLIALAGC